MLAGTFVNPYGWHLHAHVIEFLSHDRQFNQILSEWQRFDFAHHPSRGLVEFMFALSIGGALAALLTRRWAHLLVIAMAVCAGLAAARGIPATALLALPLANGAFTRLLQSRGLWRSLLDAGGALQQIDAGHHGAALAPAAAILLLLWLRLPAVAERTGFLDGEYPVRACDTIAGLPLFSRIFASPLDGGYMIYRFAGERKIWLDWRIDYFGPEPYRKLDQIEQTELGWDRLMGEAAFTHALVRRDIALGGALERAGWQRLYGDDRFTLWQKPQTTNPSYEIGQRQLHDSRKPIAHDLHFDLGAGSLGSETLP